MNKYDVVVSKKYIRNGEEKTQWNRVGTILKFPATEDKKESFVLELNMFPNTKFNVFEQKPKQEEVKKSTLTSPSEDYPEGIDTEEIPF